VDHKAVRSWPPASFAPSRGSVLAPQSPPMLSSSSPTAYLDGCDIHKLAGIRKTIESRDARSLFLPP